MPLFVHPARNDAQTPCRALPYKHTEPVHNLRPVQTLRRAESRIATTPGRASQGGPGAVTMTLLEASISDLTAVEAATIVIACSMLANRDVPETS